jgi:hypothetical protein
MIDFSMQELTHWNGLQVLFMNIKIRSVKNPGGSITPDEKGMLLKTHVPAMQKFCQRYGLNGSLSQINTFEQNVFFGRLVSDTNIAAVLESFQITLRDETYSRKFAFIPQSKIEYFQKDKLFGDEVDAAFPIAKDEIKDAGNCLAVGLDTAAIFHLMRIIELGLRALAKKLKVRIPNTPIEYATWETAIKHIEEEIKKLRQLSKGKKKSNLLEFYNGCMGEFNAFKDVWRNNIMHTRQSYDEHQAMSVFLHVRAFMERLSKNL